MKFTADFKSFLKNEVNLNQTRIDRLQTSVSAIETFIAEHDTFSDIFLDIIPAGSWAHRTIIRPVMETDEFDADVLLYVQEQLTWKPKEYIDNLYSAFHENATYKAMAQRKTRCVRINYKDDFHIDVVPYLKRGAGHFITNRLEPEDEGCFESSDPEAFTEWIDERQRFTNGTFVKVVRLLKYLRDYKNTFSCKSIILTTLLGSEINAIEASLNPELYADVPTTLSTLLSKLASSLPAEMPTIMDPAETGENFTDRYRDSWDYSNFRDKIIYYADKIKQAYEETEDREKSIRLWQEVFGSGFKPGALVKAASLTPYSASVPWGEEQFINDATFGHPIQLQPGMDLRISGRCSGLKVGSCSRSNGFRQFELTKYGNRVPKNRNLQFTASINVPKPYRIFWKVRNGGQEAANSNALRGEITEGQVGSVTKTESTLYKGTHYVECYVVKDDRVVAIDRQPVIVF